MKKNDMRVASQGREERKETETTSVKVTASGE